jgi:PqqD family protein of HPr-rel-A system
MGRDDNDSSWGVPDPQGILWEEFEDECVVFNPLSGDTHYLNLTAAEILKLIHERPRTLKELLDAFTSLFELEEDIDLHGSVRRVLQEFEDAGLICPLQS